jgi:hypothetical protein
MALKMENASARRKLRRGLSGEFAFGAPAADASKSQIVTSNADVKKLVAAGDDAVQWARRAFQAISEGRIKTRRCRKIE